MHTSNRPEAGNQWGRWGSLSVIGPLSSKPLHVPNLPETASSSGGGGGGGRFKPSFMAAWLAACDEWDALSLSLFLFPSPLNCCVQALMIYKSQLLRLHIQRILNMAPTICHYDQFRFAC